MAFPIERCGAVILAGGQSRRMGTCKARLCIGGEPMLSRLSRQLSAFDERLLSANDPALAEGLSLRVVADRYPNAGPLSGLHAALTAARSEALFCIPCDMPYFTPELPRLLLDRFVDEEAMVCRDSTGRVYPLCGIYTKAALTALTAQLDRQCFRAMELLPALRCTVVDTAGLLPDRVFFNMNTPEAFQSLAANQKINL